MRKAFVADKGRYQFVLTGFIMACARQCAYSGLKIPGTQIQHNQYYGNSYTQHLVLS